MGGCYSTAGHQHRSLAPSKHKMPRDAGINQQNGKSTSNPCDVKSANGLPGEDLHQSLKRRSKEIDVRSSQLYSPVQGLTSTESFTAPDNMRLLISSLDGQLTTGVVPSDSGIESIGSPQEETISEPQEIMKQDLTLCWSCQQRLKRLSRGSCQQCGNLRVDPSHSPVLLVEDTYCTCGPRRLGKQPTCRTHKSKAKLDPANRHSDFDGVGLKSSLKKNRLALAEGKRLRMSWKSTDSVDLNMSLCTCMDQAKSVASEIFGDDVSFRAPLAQFDSVDCRLDDKDSFHAVCGAGPVMSHRLSIYSEIIDLVDSICKCDNPADGGTDERKKEDQKRGEEGKTQDNTLGNTQDNSGDPILNGCSSTSMYPPFVTKRASRLSSSFSVSSSDERMYSESTLQRLISDKRDHRCPGSELCHLLESVSDDDQGVFDETEKLLSEEAVPDGEMGTTHASRISSSGPPSRLCPVCTRGRRVVVMDQELYVQMLRDLAFLREQLGQLSEVIQSDTGLAEQLSFSEDNET